MRGCKSGIPLPDQIDLINKIDYNQETGILIWKTGKGQGNTINGMYATLNGKYGRTRYKVSRLIWRLVTGEDPGSEVIDHIDGNNKNQSWSNLRRVTQSVNAQNRKARGKYLKGVVFFRGWFRTQIHNKHVGRFKTELEAHKNYVKLVEHYRR